MECGWHVCALNMKKVVVIALFLLKAALHVQGTSQAALMSTLFSSYDTSVRPICPQPLVVYVGLAIRQVIELDEPKQVLYLNTWIRLRWNDCQLQWNSSDYANITNLILPYEKVWTPDITLYDSVETDLDSVKGYRVSVYSDGTVYYNFPYRVAAMCNVDVTYFPYDTQRCPLQFGSWAYHGYELDVQNRSAEGDISSFVPSSEFNIPSVPLERHVVYYGCCPEPYPDVTFYVILERKPTFYVLSLIFPCVLITTTAMLGFVLPPDSGEKIGLEITVLLSLAVFQLVLSDSLPASSETFPYIGVYFAGAMVLVMLSTVLTVLVLNFHHKDCMTLPRWMRVLFLDYLARAVCLGKFPSTSVVPDHVESSHRKTRNKDSEDFSNHNGGQHTELPHQPNKDDISTDFSLRLPALPPSPEIPSGDTSQLVHLLKEQLHVLKRAEERSQQKVDHDHQKSEWKRLATVLDRVFLILFALSSFITAMAILVPLSSH